MSLPSFVLEADEKATRAIAEFGADDERALSTRSLALNARVSCRAYSSALSLVDQLVADYTRVRGRFDEMTDKVNRAKWKCLHFSGDKNRARELANGNMEAWKAAKGAEDVHTLQWQFRHGESTEGEPGIELMTEVFILSRDALGPTHELTRTNKQQGLSSSLLILHC